MAAPDEVIYESRLRTWKLVLFAGMFVVLGWFLVAVVSDDEGFRWHRIAAPVGVLGIAFGSLALTVLVPRAVRRRPVLTLSEEGFIDGSPMGGRTFVPWREVIEMSVVHFGSVKNIAGRVERPERLRREKRGSARWMSRINRRFADFWIADSYLPEPAEAVIERARSLAIRHNRPRLMGQIGRLDGGVVAYPPDRPESAIGVALVGTLRARSSNRERFGRAAGGRRKPRTADDVVR